MCSILVALTWFLAIPLQRDKRTLFLASPLHLDTSKRLTLFLQKIYIRASEVHPQMSKIAKEQYRAVVRSSL